MNESTTNEQYPEADKYLQWHELSVINKVLDATDDGSLKMVYPGCDDFSQEETQDLKRLAKAIRENVDAAILCEQIRDCASGLARLRAVYRSLRRWRAYSPTAGYHLRLDS